MRFTPVALVLCLLLAGCGVQEKPETPVSVAPKTHPTPPPQDASTADGVRKVLAKEFDVDPAAIPFDQPLSNPPCKATEIDLIDIVSLLEERFSISIPNRELDLDGIKTDEGEPTVRITPRQLVEIVDRLRSQAKESSVQK